MADSGKSFSVSAVTSLYANTSLSTPEIRGHPASFEAQVAISAFIAILGIWSTLGNILTIMAISMQREVQIKCNYFIFSLALSDLASGLIASPLWLYRRTWGFQTWRWGQFLCKLFWFVDESTSYCTAMHIASFAIWRYMGVKWPNLHEKLRPRTVKLWIITIWVIALVFGGAVFSTFYAVENERHHALGENYSRWPACSIKTADNGVLKHRVYYTFSSAFFMLLPMTLLFVSSIFIIRELFWHSVVKSPRRKQQERTAACQLALISSSFLVGYIPMTSYVMWTTRRTEGDYRLDYWIHLTSYFCIRISECFNPIVYNVASQRMRRASIKVLHYIKNCCLSDAEVEFMSHSPLRPRRFLTHGPFHVIRNVSNKDAHLTPSSRRRHTKAVLMHEKLQRVRHTTI